MDINVILNGILPVVFGLVGIALIVFVIELIKIMKVTRSMIEDVKPKLDKTMANVEEMTTSITPVMDKVEPMVDSLQLTVDSVNLEMMRVDQILEDVTDITDAASSATAAVDNITNAPINAVNNVATRVRSVFGSKNASNESAKLAEQRVAVARALEDYKAAEQKEAAKADDAKGAPKKVGDKAREADGGRADAPLDGGEASDGDNADSGFEPIDTESMATDGFPNSYVKKFEEGSEPVIDPKVIAESPFFEEESDAD